MINPSLTPWLTHAQLAVVRVKYFQLAAYVDGQVGRVLQYLEQSPFADALVIFTTDHGTLQLVQTRTQTSPQGLSRPMLACP